MTDYSPEEYSAYRLQRALETIIEVETHIENEYWNTAVNRMYYACFYAVGALLIKHDVSPSTHSGVRQLFGQLFVKTGKINRTLAKHYTDLFEKRNKGDYNDFFDYDGDTVKNLLPPTKEFIDSIKKLVEE
jgi:uncharacterized protein (UPF0332 family)